MTKKKQKNVKFSSQANVGALEASRDSLLEQCFLEKGDEEILTDYDDHRCIIVGRTGAGKTALIERIKTVQREKVISIDPHSLSLSYIANNNTIQAFEQQNISLRPFYRLLWKHVFVTEIIRKHYNITSQRGMDKFLQSISEILRRDKAKQEAVDYLRQWGEKFWETTELRIKEVMRKFTTQLEDTASGGLKGGTTVVEASSALGHKKAEESIEEQKIEYINRGRGIINDIQISKLQLVIKLLAEDILTDFQKTYYITIDQLDEDWIEDSIRYKLIFELITATSELNNRLNGSVKIIIALREDLLQRVYSYMQEQSGVQFQKEKYEDLYYQLNWTPAQLRNFLRRRIERLHEKNFTSEQIEFEDVFPESITVTDLISNTNKEHVPITYILERTMLIPRDVIRFINRCISSITLSTSGSFNKTTILTAERHYSEDRLEALEDEWRVNYPNLRRVTELLRGRPARFNIKDFDNEHAKIDKVFETLKPGCPIYDILAQAYGENDLSQTLAHLFYIMFTVGLIGIERHNNSHIYWCYIENRITLPDFYAPSSTLYIHPGFYFALDIKSQK